MDQHQVCQLAQEQPSQWWPRVLKATWLAPHPPAERHTHRTTSTAPARTLGSLPMIETLAVKEPSMLKTTASVPRDTTVRQHSA